MLHDHAYDRRSRVTAHGAKANFTAAALLVLVLLAAGCEREARRFRDSPPAARGADVSVSGLRPGPRAAPSANQPGPYEGNAWAVSEGQRNFRQFNCVGCHFNGGGGIGPALMDRQWIYGSKPAQIFASIVEGRPNGMPAFQGKLTDQQVWELVAYVRSLSGQLRKDVEPGRDEHMNARSAPQSTPPEKPVNAD